MTHSPNNHRVQRILRQHVQTDQLLGVDAVPINCDLATAAAAESSRSAGDMRDSRSSPPHADVSAPDRTAGAGQRGGFSEDTHRRPAQTMESSDDMAKKTTLLETSLFGSMVEAGMTTAALRKRINDGPPAMGRDERIRVLNEMNETEVRGCTKCGLCEGRTQTVFGEGSVEAEIMFIGEGPGQNEDEQGKPFVGRAGGLLEKQINAMGFSREEVFITNIVKCRPPNNRAPTPAEVDQCSDYLRRQILTIRPKAIVTLGGPAAKALLGSKTGITKLRGTWHEISLGPGEAKIPVMPTFHPAYLLRSYTIENRKKVWDDLKKVLDLLGKKPRATE